MLKEITIVICNMYGFLSLLEYSKDMIIRGVAFKQHLQYKLLC